MLDGMIITKLKKIDDSKGSVMHFLKKNENSFLEFGEAYFSLVNNQCIKAWKKHKKMTMNLTVPVGRVVFKFYDTREKSKTLNMSFCKTLSQDNLYRLTVPPGIWFGFEGISNRENLICNIANMVHDPDEVQRQNLINFHIDWRKI